MSALEISLFAWIHEANTKNHHRTEELVIGAADVAEVKEILGQVHTLIETIRAQQAAEKE